MSKTLTILLTFIAFSQSEKIPFPGDFEEIVYPWENPFFIEMLSLLSINRTEAERSMPNTRIINGEPAVLGQYPHMVFLLLKDENNKTSGCGGSLIEMNWILTAAHCVKRATLGLALAGIVDLNGTAEWSEIFNKSQVFIHPEFTMALHMDNDIALIKLSEDIPCSENIGIVDLPCKCDAKYDLNGREVTTFGFGSDNGNSSKVTSDLKYIAMDVMSNDECKKLFPIPIFDSMLCTDTSDGKSSCMGDSGSGVTATIRHRNVLVGLVSFGNLKCLTGKEYPAVNTRVSSYLEWIENTIKDNSSQKVDRK